LLIQRLIQKPIILSLLVIGFAMTVPLSAWSLDLESVFANTAVVAPARVEFREERHNPMLKEPVVLSGYLEYLEPGRLRKVIETPYQEAFLVTDDYIEITRDGQSRRLSLSKSRPIRSMLGGIEAILAGQTERLDSQFEHELSGNLLDWSLQLEPKSKRVAKHLQSMLVKGGEQRMSSIRINLNEGEWSLMEIVEPGQEPEQ
jgi:hypothetical protein